ncbi:MAG: hypothetical protein LBU76_03470 [Azoarcus sp.]|nr:hypothetical protein [Azoarcus sp.]
MTTREIVTPQAYPPEMLEKLGRSSNLSISIANRWMLGWPDRVKTLLESGEYWAALENQAEQELDAWVEATQSGAGESLSQWEINELAGLDPAPPVP